MNKLAKLKKEIKRDINTIEKYEKKGWAWGINGNEVPAHYALAYHEWFLKKLEELDK